MDISTQILSDITVHMKYARYLSTLNRRETWDELVTRNYNMHDEKIKNLNDECQNLSILSHRLIEVGKGVTADCPVWIIE